MLNRQELPKHLSEREWNLLSDIETEGWYLLDKTRWLELENSFRALLRHHWIDFMGTPSLLAKERKSERYRCLKRYINCLQTGSAIFGARSLLRLTINRRSSTQWVVDLENSYEEIYNANCKSISNIPKSFICFVKKIVIWYNLFKLRKVVLVGRNGNVWIYITLMLYSLVFEFKWQFLLINEFRIHFGKCTTQFGYRMCTCLWKVTYLVLCRWQFE